MATTVLGEPDAQHDFQVSRKELLKQLERVVTSSHFRNSKRYPSFLRFIVERTVDANTEVLKERNLGTEVFGRPIDYDTSTDPIVRVTAGEVRKRLAQYYQDPGHNQEVRIELPLGSYVPHFYPAGGGSRHDVELRPPPQSENDAANPVSVRVEREVVLPTRNLVARGIGPANTPRWLIFSLCIVAVVVAIAGSGFGLGLMRSRADNQGIEYFWQSATSTNNTLIVMGVHSSDASGRDFPADPKASVVRRQQQTALSAMADSDMVPVSDVVSYSRITDLLTRRSAKYATKGSTDTSLDELRLGPVVLVGGFNNVWTMRLASRLRYRLVPKTDTVNQIQDSEHPSVVWAFDNQEPAIVNSRDYAIVASYYDTTIEQHVVIAAGIGKNGTTAAAEFLTSDKDLKNWLAEAKVPANKNVELVLSTEVLDGQPGPPHVIATSVW